MTIDLPGKVGSCWTATAPKTDYPHFELSDDTTVAIIGAGIVGLSAAYLLAQAGVSVAVLEGRRIGGQVTGGSTAKITTQHSLIYQHLIETLGLSSAQQYAHANDLALNQIRTWIDDLKIDCDFDPKDAFVYCRDPRRLQDLEAEAEAARAVGIAADIVARAPLPFEAAGALRFRDQAQFNPAKYLVGLAQAAEGASAKIYENSRVLNVEQNDVWHVKTEAGVLAADYVVQATNLPIWGPVAFDEATRPRCHIAMAFRLQREAFEGMFIGLDDPHSLRMGSDNSGPLLIALGPKFITGQEGNVAQHFRDLDVWARRHFDLGDAAWRWVNEDYDTSDRVPYVGELEGAPRLYVATGFNGWGISNGTAAAILISKRILGEMPEWGRLFDPMRELPKDFNEGGDTHSLVDALQYIPSGEGRVISAGDGMMAVHRSVDGALHAVSAECTHKGCIITWNNAECTWDCPCHGSIFAADGTVLHGPAVEPLPRKKVPTNS